MSSVHIKLSNLKQQVVAQSDRPKSQQDVGFPVDRAQDEVEHFQALGPKKVDPAHGVASAQGLEGFEQKKRVEQHQSECQRQLAKNGRIKGEQRQHQEKASDQTGQQTDDAESQGDEGDDFTDHQPHLFGQMWQFDEKEI